MPPERLNINQMFRNLTQFTPTGDNPQNTVSDEVLQGTYIPLGLQLYNTITNENLTIIDYTDATTGDLLSDNIIALFVSYFAEISANKNIISDQFGKVAHPFLQMGYVLLQAKYPLRFKTMSGLFVVQERAIGLITTAVFNKETNTTEVE